jgi:hypothetical protein
LSLEVYFKLHVLMKGKKIMDDDDDDEMPGSRNRGVIS